MLLAGREGEAGRRRRGREGEERSPCTWSQPPSFPIPLPGSPRLHRTPWLPGRPARPLRSAFAKTAPAGAMDAAAEAAGGGDVATATASPATARANIPLPTETTPRRHDSAEGCRARRARARARGTVGRAGAKAEASVLQRGAARAA